MSTHNSAFGTLSASLRMAILVFFVFGFLYSLLGVGAGQVLAPERAKGSLVYLNDEVRGSEWVGQNFSNPKYFMGRPSASKNDPMAMAGSNLARSNADLEQQIRTRDADVRKRLGLGLEQAIPSDLLTASGSGTDPHISPDSARIQIASVAKARGLTPEEIGQVVEQHIEPTLFGIFGQERVNVLKLNLALDLNS